jgi:hypothetical protein
VDVSRIEPSNFIAAKRLKRYFDNVWLWAFANSLIGHHSLGSKATSFSKRIQPRSHAGLIRLFNVISTCCNENMERWYLIHTRYTPPQVSFRSRLLLPYGLVAEWSTWMRAWQTFYVNGYIVAYYLQWSGNQLDCPMWWHDRARLLGWWYFPSNTCFRFSKLAHLAICKWLESPKWDTKGSKKLFWNKRETYYLVDCRYLPVWCKRETRWLARTYSSSQSGVCIWLRHVKYSSVLI